MVTYEYLPVLLLTSGLVCPHAALREYHLINVAKNWTDAQSYCRVHYTDLATVGSHDEAALIAQTQTDGNVASTRWIGLRETAPLDWRWSVGEVSAYNNWADPFSDICGAMKSDGKWYSTKCGNAYAFICQRVDAPEELYMVPESKTWRQAQTHCRQNQWDLASARSRHENEELRQLVNEFSYEQVWIGLFQDEWEWSDLSKTVFRDWHSTQPNNDGRCTLYSATGWYDRACRNLHPFYCQGEKKSIERVLMFEITSNSLFQLSDSAVGDAILNQIQTQYPELTFQWNIQPDGNIFQKKEEKLFTPSS